MKCPCPKCDVTIEISDQEISARGSQNCPECKQKYWAQREEFMLRAYKKQGKLYCIGCGHELGCEMLCVQCGSLCPDYCIVQTSKPVVHKQKSAGFSFTGFNFSLTKGSSSTSTAATPRATTDSAAKASGNWMARAAIAALVLVLIVGSAKFYQDYKADQAFSKDFIVALYGVKAGTDLSLKKIDYISSGWQQTAETTNIPPRLSQKDLDKLQQVKNRIGKAVVSLNDSPEEFDEAKQNLVRLHKVYEKIYSLNVSEPGSLDAFMASNRKLEASFLKTAKELKRTMPEVLLEKLQASLDKYPNLKFMTEKG